MKLVYRVETTEGDGPYQDSSGFPGVWDMCADHTDSKHVSPNHYESGLNGIRPWEVCACDSPESLVAWFGAWLEKLGKAGFVVTIYNAPRARVGANGQVCFNRDRATRKDRLRMEDFIGCFA